MSVNPNVLHSSLTNNTNKAYATNIGEATNPGGEDDDTTSKLTLDLAGDANQVTPAQVGVVAYRSNNITVTAQGYRNYHLTLSAMLGSGSELHGKNNPYATIVGVGSNVTPENFGDNTWGYAVTENTDEENSSLTYNTVPTYGENAELGSGMGLKGILTEKQYKLTFAAKFGKDAPSDDYQGQLLLSVVGMPGWVVQITDIVNMQDIDAEICEESTVGQTSILTDSRDGKKYYVAKLADNNCWMTQNLAYDGGGASRGTSCSGWTDADSYAQYCSPGHTDGNHGSRGNYYSWVAAKNGDPSASGQVRGVCPDGWHLPTTGTTRGSFGGLTTAYGVANNTVGSRIMRDAPLYFILSGRAIAKGIIEVGTTGWYWSSSGTTQYANYAQITDGTVFPSTSYNGYLGNSVRCVADF